MSPAEISAIAGVRSIRAKGPETTVIGAVAFVCPAPSAMLTTPVPAVTNDARAPVEGDPAVSEPKPPVIVQFTAQGPRGLSRESQAVAVKDIPVPATTVPGFQGETPMRPTSRTLTAAWAWRPPETTWTYPPKSAVDCARRGAAVSFHAENVPESVVQIEPDSTTGFPQESRPDAVKF